MLHYTPCNLECTQEVDGVDVYFSLASEGTKVNTYALRALLLLIA